MGIDKYWSAISGENSYSELDNDLIKNLSNLDSFTYHVGDNDFVIDFSDGSFNANGVEISAPEGYSQESASLYYKSTRQNGGMYRVELGYELNGTKHYIIIDYQSNLVDRVNL